MISSLRALRVLRGLLFARLGVLRVECGTMGWTRRPRKCLWDMVDLSLGPGQTRRYPNLGHMVNRKGRAKKCTRVAKSGV